eukprot:g1825.t1
MADGFRIKIKCGIAHQVRSTSRLMTLSRKTSQTRWEVDNQDAGGGPWMSSWRMEKRAAQVDHKIVRLVLDPQFGIVQCAFLTGLLTREYVIVVHGWVPTDWQIDDLFHRCVAHLWVLARLRC